MEIIVSRWTYHATAQLWVADQEWEEDAGVSQSVLTGVWWLGGVEAAEDGWVRFQALPAA